MMERRRLSRYITLILSLYRRDSRDKDDLKSAKSMIPKNLNDEDRRNAVNLIEEYLNIKSN